MVWINLFIVLISSCFAAELPKLLTKHASDTLRFISSDGRYAYVQKRPGVLGLVSSFRSTDFISESAQNDFIVTASRFKQRVAIEVIPGAHQDYNLLKNHKIMVVDWGGTKTKEIGSGKNAKLHLQDEWITYYDAYNKLLIIQNVLTQKKHQIKLANRINPFYIPEIELITDATVVYTDINEKGFSALIQFNLNTRKSNILYRSSQSGTRLELCQNKGYLGIGEFPFGDVSRGSKILQIALSGSTNLAGFTTLYSSSDQDVGNMVCLEKSIYFIKTLAHSKKLNLKETEAVKLDLKTKALVTKSNLKNITQLILMDERVLAPFRGDFYVLEGSADLSDDKLKSVLQDKEEELPLDL